MRPDSCRSEPVVCCLCKQAKPSSELERLLQRIAPDKEVMIGISNYRLVEGGELVSFLEVLLFWAHSFASAQLAPGLVLTSWKATAAADET